MGWHIIFGIEQNVDALLSPTHLVLLIGALLILSSPFRAGWSNNAMKAPGWREFAPPFSLWLSRLEQSASFSCMRGCSVIICLRRR